jgi:hypothetical protein
MVDCVRAPVALEKGCQTHLPWSTASSGDAAGWAQDEIEVELASGHPERCRRCNRADPASVVTSPWRYDSRRTSRIVPQTSVQVPIPRARSRHEQSCDFPCKPPANGWKTRLFFASSIQVRACCGDHWLRRLLPRQGWQTGLPDALGKKLNRPPFVSACQTQLPSPQSSESFPLLFGERFLQEKSPRRCDASQ